MTVFVIDHAVIAILNDLRERAEANPVSEAAMRKIVAGGKVSKTSRYQTVTLPFGFTLTMTVEWQPFGQARHISIASPDPNKVPVPEAIDLILPYLGFEIPLSRCYVQPEHMLNGGIAISVLAPLVGSFEELEQATSTIN
jgi:hypothetical protein